MNYFTTSFFAIIKSNCFKHKSRENELRILINMKIIVLMTAQRKVRLRIVNKSQRMKSDKVKTRTDLNPDHKLCPTYNERFKQLRTIQRFPLSK